VHREQEQLGRHEVEYPRHCLWVSARAEALELSVLGSFGHADHLASVRGLTSHA